MDRPHGLCAGRIDRTKTFKGVKFEVLVGTGKHPYPVRAVTHMIDAETGQHIIYDPWAADQLREQLGKCASLLRDWVNIRRDDQGSASLMQATETTIADATAIITDLEARDVPGGEDIGR